MKGGERHGEYLHPRKPRPTSIVRPSGIHLGVRADNGDHCDTSDSCGYLDTDKPNGWSHSFLSMDSRGRNGTAPLTARRGAAARCRNDWGGHRPEAQLVSAVRQGAASHGSARET
jgi:hypothetical protein